MNGHVIGQLVRLRYQLLWAKARSRSGRVTLLAIGVVLMLLLSGLLSAGGFGAGVIAIRTGHATRIAEKVLSGLFVATVFATLIAGFGIDAAFTDADLRRYPLTSLQRFMARHVLGIADPYWCCFLALELGLITGLHASGGFSLWRGGTAALLLLMCAYLLTHVVSAWIQHRMVVRSRSLGVLLVVAGACVPAGIVALLQYPRELPAIVFLLLRWTPPFGAAAVMAEPSELPLGVGVLAGWLGVLLALLLRLERRPALLRRQAPDYAGSLWRSPVDQIAGLFGGRTGPLVGCWLRLYLRNHRFRLLSCLSLPIAVILAVGIGHPRQPGGSLFVGVLGGAAIVPFLATARIAANQYGYAAAGLRRLLLLPIDPGASLRAGSIVAVLLGAVWLPPIAALWTIFAPRPLDARILLMPVMNAMTALFLFQALGLWTSMYAPRRTSYDKVFGNDMTLAGNVAFFGVLFGSLGLPPLLRAVVPEAITPENWWLTLPPAGLALAFYLLSLTIVGHAHVGREQLLAAVEGK